MATSTNLATLQQDVQQYRLNAIFERRAGNHAEAAAWDAEADALEHRIILMSTNG
jgi:hypothetical protein